jgi:hypothetical protein
VENSEISQTPLTRRFASAHRGTVGANTGGATEQYKVQGGLLTTLHAGDKVSFSVSETGGTKTITKLEKQ